ncbi:multidrug efflux SMR transporter [Jannaschia sp. LMIT008]|uniref:DMT family transporter n=1 Tax=Jannaschia maritima TaxID=3032585 RepID=UPI00281287CB|nr:multidrug efflux SMR transporter [Jannaschia sp. LMIT008]
MAWVYLVFAIAFEVIGTSALKASEGLTRLGPTAVAIVAYGGALGLLALVLQSIPVGVAYAIWSGLGIVLIAVIGWMAFGQRLDTPAVIGIVLIVAGIVVMQLFSDVT